MPKYYPAFIDVNERICVVIGGGSMGEEKAEKLLACGARVRLISPTLNVELSELEKKGVIEWVPRNYQHGDLEGVFIAILTVTHDLDVNNQVSKEATERNVPLNVVDVTHLCTFIAPSVAIRGDVTIATSTGGSSPALARTFREKIESDCPCRLLEFADLSNILSWARGKVRENNWSIEPSFWQKCIDVELVDLVQSGKEDFAKEKLITRLEKGVSKR